MSKSIIIRALRDSFMKLDPRLQVKNPVMFCVYVVSVITFILFIVSLFNVKDSGVSSVYILAVAILLFITVLFSNFAEAIAEGKGKAQADALRKSRSSIKAHRVFGVDSRDSFEVIDASTLKKGDLVVVSQGEVIPSDGEVIYGCASVDESAITGESAPVIRAAGGDSNSVTGGTVVLSDKIVVRISCDSGNSFMDKMISMVEGASRKKTPNEVALEILLDALTIIFLLVTVSLYCYSVLRMREADVNGGGGFNTLPLVYLVALFVCLAPTTIGALLSAIGISGMSRLNKANVMALSGRAIEAAGDVDVLLLDKTGTITLGNRVASQIIPVDGNDAMDVARCALISSLYDETPEGRSVVLLVYERYGISIEDIDKGEIVSTLEFSATHRMSGVDLKDYEIRKGAYDAIVAYASSKGGVYSQECRNVVEGISKLGATPLIIAKNGQIVGVIELKDTLKPGIKEKFSELREAGIKTIMITGDNPITAASIAGEAGVDDFLAEATPEGKLELIKRYQADGLIVAMTGDGTNDAPALAQADVAVAMNSGTQAAKDACNMVDLDSSPVKLIEIVKIGKQLLMTRGALTTFSIANDISKYFAIIPAMFSSLAALNIMRLHSPMSAVLSAVIYNAIIIVLLIPLALKGVRYKERKASSTLKINLLIYGLGGLIVPFIAIKLIDMILALFM